MSARQQEPPSSHLHGAGHNTSISRQRRTTKKTRWGIRCRFLFWKYQMARSGADQRAGADAGVRL